MEICLKSYKGKVFYVKTEFCVYIIMQVQKEIQIKEPVEPVIIESNNNINSDNLEIHTF